MQVQTSTPSGGTSPPAAEAAGDADAEPPQGRRDDWACAEKAARAAGLIIRHAGPDEDLVADRPFKPAEVIFEFRNVIWRAKRDRFTVEYAGGRHFFDPLLARVSHACNPNARVSMTLMALVARRDIAPGEAITYDYFSTESAIAAPFLCRCGAPRCRGWISTRPTSPSSTES